MEIITQFFHVMVIARQSRNYISVLNYFEGNKLTSYSQITNEAVTFFKKLIGTVDPNVVGCS